MEGEFGSLFLDQLEDPGVGDNHPIRLDLIQGLKSLGQALDIIVMREEIESEVDLASPRMGINDPLCHLLQGELGATA